MPFEKGSKHINRAGRIPKKEKETPRQIREKELLSLLRKFKPHVSRAVATAAKMLELESPVAPATKLQACKIILENYKDLVDGIYDIDLSDDEEGPEGIDDNRAPILHLTVQSPKEE